MLRQGGLKLADLTFQLGDDAHGGAAGCRERGGAGAGGELVGAQGSGDLAGAGINIALASTLIA